MRMIRHEMKMNSKTFYLWSLIIGGCIFCFMLIFPSMADQMKAMSDVYSDMGGFSAAFGLDQINFGTPMGFYGIEAGSMLSIGGGMFGALIGISMLSKEEGNHTSEFIFTMPLTRKEIVIYKGITMLLLIFLFDLVCVAMGTVSFLIIGEDMEVKKFCLYHLAQSMMHIEIGMVCFGISAFLKKNSIGIGFGVAIILYFLQMFVNISDKVEFLKYITPYYYADAANIFPSQEIDIVLLGIGIATGIIIMTIGVGKYINKDLAA